MNYQQMDLYDLHQTLHELIAVPSEDGERWPVADEVIVIQQELGKRYADWCKTVGVLDETSA